MGLFEKRRKAFTLIELIIVVAIIIIISATAPMLSSGIIVERQVYNAATQIQQDLLLVQNLAITHSSDNAARFRIRFYPAQNRYVIEASEDANLVTGKGKLIRRQFTSTIGFPLFFGKNVPDSVVFGVKSCPPLSYLDVSFNNSGVPHTGGGHINIITQNGTKQAQVIVSIIGRVRIEWVKK
jgi:prepilin-type N-terminal cleavage/methylation domain-containing protein